MEKTIKEIREENHKKAAPTFYVKEFSANYNNRKITLKINGNVYQYSSNDGYFWIKRPDGKFHWFEFRKGREHKFTVKNKQLICDAEPFVKFDLPSDLAEIHLRNKKAEPLRQVKNPRVSKPLGGFFPIAFWGVILWRKNRMEKIKND